MIPDPKSIAQLLRAAAEAEGFDVIQIRVDARRHVRMWVDLEGEETININHCTQLSRHLGGVMEEEGLDTGSFQFEVQSPGIDRILAREKDFVRFAGEQVSVRLMKKRGDRGKFAGKLTGCQEGNVAVTGPEGEAWEFALNEIREARLVPDLPFSKDGRRQNGPRQQKRRKHKKRNRPR